MAWLPITAGLAAQMGTHAELVVVLFNAQRGPAALVLGASACRTQISFMRTVLSAAVWKTA